MSPSRILNPGDFIWVEDPSSRWNGYKGTIHCFEKDVFDEKIEWVFIILEKPEIMVKTTLGKIRKDDEKANS